MKRGLNWWHLCVCCSVSVALFVHSTQFLRAADEENADAKPTKTREVVIQDIKLVVPETWKQEQPKSRLRLSQFEIPVAKEDKEPGLLTVSFFGGGGGGIDANIQRWVGQFDSQGRKATITTGTSEQGVYYFADIKGTYMKPVGPPFLRKTEKTPGSRMLAVFLNVEGKGNYFLKMTGPEKTVAAAVKAMRVSFGADAEKEKEWKGKE